MLYISSERKANGLTIELCSSKDMEVWKERLYFGDRQKKSYLSEVDKIHKELKTSSNYSRTRIIFQPQDHYTDETDMYSMFWFDQSKGERKPNIKEETFGSIPKAWDKEIEIRFVDCKRYSAIFKAIKLLGFNLTEQETKDIKKMFSNCKFIENMRLRDE